MSEAIQKATLDHDIRMRQLTDQIDGLERQYIEIMERNKDEESRLRREKSRAENSLTLKITNYDNEMITKKNILLSLNNAYNNEMSEYLLLKKHFDEVDEDIGRSLIEDNILQSVMKREEFGRWMLNQAAINIQKYYRGNIGRVVAMKLKAKRNKKKRKGKPKSAKK